MNNKHQHTFNEFLYALKKHWATRLHYDLRLWWNGVLLSWAIPVGQKDRGSVELCTAVEMEDHAAANLLFEGRHKTGTIMAWDRGTWEPHVGYSDVLASLARGTLQFTLRGEKLSGVVTLTRMNTVTAGGRPEWSLRREAGVFTESPLRRFAQDTWRNSIITGRSQERIESDWNGMKPKQPNLFGWA